MALTTSNECSLAYCSSYNSSCSYCSNRPALGIITLEDQRREFYCGGDQALASYYYALLLRWTCNIDCTHELLQQQYQRGFTGSPFLTCVSKYPVYLYTSLPKSSFLQVRMSHEKQSIPYQMALYCVDVISEI